MENYTPMLPMLTTFNLDGLGDTLRVSTQPVASSAQASSNANEARYVPVIVRAPFYITTAFWANGATVFGNVDVGIYTEGGTRLANTGSGSGTAQSGISNLQSAPLSANVLLTPGFYYLAWVADNTTSTMLGTGSTTADDRRFGVFTQTSAFPLPATATFSNATTSRWCVVGVTSRSVL